MSTVEEVERALGFDPKTKTEARRRMLLQSDKGRRPSTGLWEDPALARAVQRGEAGARLRDGGL